MGATDASHAFEARNEREALSKAREIMAEASDYFGADPYAGHIGLANGLEFRRTSAPLTAEKAHALLFGDEGNDYRGLAKKGECAWVVRIRNTGSRRARWLVGALVPC